jgi:hypothetical protein
LQLARASRAAGLPKNATEADLRSTLEQVRDTIQSDKPDGKVTNNALKRLLIITADKGRGGMSAEEKTAVIFNAGIRFGLWDHEGKIKPKAGAAPAPISAEEFTLPPGFQKTAEGKIVQEVPPRFPSPGPPPPLNLAAYEPTPYRPFSGPLEYWKIRDEMSQKQFGKPFSELSSEQRGAVEGQAKAEWAKQEREFRLKEFEKEPNAGEKLRVAQQAFGKHYVDLTEAEKARVWKKLQWDKEARELGFEDVEAKDALAWKNHGKWYFELPYEQAQEINRKIATAKEKFGKRYDELTDAERAEVDKAVAEAVATAEQTQAPPAPPQAAPAPVALAQGEVQPQAAPQPAAGAAIATVTDDLLLDSLANHQFGKPWAELNKRQKAQVNKLLPTVRQSLEKAIGPSAAAAPAPAPAAVAAGAEPPAPTAPSGSAPVGGPEPPAGPVPPSGPKPAPKPAAPAAPAGPVQPSAALPRSPWRIPTVDDLKPGAVFRTELGATYEILGVKNGRVRAKFKVNDKAPAEEINPPIETFAQGFRHMTIEKEGSGAAPSPPPKPVARSAPGAPVAAAGSSAPPVPSPVAPVGAGTVSPGKRKGAATKAPAAKEPVEGPAAAREKAKGSTVTVGGEPVGVAKEWLNAANVTPTVADLRPGVVMVNPLGTRFEIQDVSGDSVRYRSVSAKGRTYENELSKDLILAMLPHWRVIERPTVVGSQAAARKTPQAKKAGVAPRPVLPEVTAEASVQAGGAAPARGLVPGSRYRVKRSVPDAGLRAGEVYEFAGKTKDGSTQLIDPESRSLVVVDKSIDLSNALEPVSTTSASASGGVTGKGPGAGTASEGTITQGLISKLGIGKGSQKGEGERKGATTKAEAPVQPGGELPADILDAVKAALDKLSPEQKEALKGATRRLGTGNREAGAATPDFLTFLPVETAKFVRRVADWALSRSLGVLPPERRGPEALSSPEVRNAWDATMERALGSQYKEYFPAIWQSTVAQQQEKWRPTSGRGQAKSGAEERATQAAEAPEAPEAAQPPSGPPRQVRIYRRAGAAETKAGAYEWRTTPDFGVREVVGWQGADPRTGKLSRVYPTKQKAIDAGIPAATLKQVKELRPVDVVESYVPPEFLFRFEVEGKPGTYRIPEAEMAKLGEAKPASAAVEAPKTAAPKGEAKAVAAEAEAVRPPNIPPQPVTDLPFSYSRPEPKRLGPPPQPVVRAKEVPAQRYAPKEVDQKAVEFAKRFKEWPDNEYALRRYLTLSDFEALDRIQTEGKNVYIKDIKQGRVAISFDPDSEMWVARLPVGTQAGSYRLYRGDGLASLVDFVRKNAAGAKIPAEGDITTRVGSPPKPVWPLVETSKLSRAAEQPSAESAMDSLIRVVQDAARGEVTSYAQRRGELTSDIYNFWQMLEGAKERLATLQAKGELSKRERAELRRLPQTIDTLTTLLGKRALEFKDLGPEPTGKLTEQQLDATVSRLQMRAMLGPTDIYPPERVQELALKTLQMDKLTPEQREAARLALVQEMMKSPDAFWQVAKVAGLTRHEAERLIKGLPIAATAEERIANEAMPKLKIEQQMVRAGDAQVFTKPIQRKGVQAWQVMVRDTASNRLLGSNIYVVKQGTTYNIYRGDVWTRESLLGVTKQNRTAMSKATGIVVDGLKEAMAEKTGRKRQPTRVELFPVTETGQAAGPAASSLSDARFPKEKVSEGLDLLLKFISDEKGTVDYTRLLDVSKRLIQRKIPKESGTAERPIASWVAPNGVIVPVLWRNGETHVDVAGEMFRPLLPPNAKVAKEVAAQALLSTRWVRHLDNAVNASSEALSTDGFRRAVEAATDNAIAKRSGRVTIETDLGTVDVPSSDFPELLQSPASYVWEALARQRSGAATSSRREQVEAEERLSPAEESTAIEKNVKDLIRRKVPAEYGTREQPVAAWVTPEGKPVPVMSGSGREAHEGIAAKILGRKPESPLDAELAHDELVSRGWVKLNGNSVFASREALGSPAFESAVRIAAKNAERQGNREIHVGFKEGDDWTNTISLFDVEDLLINPKAYLLNPGIAERLGVSSARPEKARAKQPPKPIARPRPTERRLSREEQELERNIERLMKRPMPKSFGTRENPTWAWVSPDGRAVPVLWGAKEMHDTVAGKILSHKYEQSGYGRERAQAELLDTGWIRVNGYSLELSPQAIGTSGFRNAVRIAAKNAERDGRSGMFISVQGQRPLKVPLEDVYDLLEDPHMYIWKGGAGFSAGRPREISRSLPPKPPLPLGDRSATAVA